MDDVFRGTIAACEGGGDVPHERESVWTVYLGDQSAYDGIMEFVSKHISCDTFVARSFGGKFEEFESKAAALST